MPNFSSVETHTASIHESVSSSILRLKSAHSTYKYSSIKCTQVLQEMSAFMTENSGYFSADGSDKTPHILGAINYLSVNNTKDPLSDCVIKDLFIMSWISLSEKCSLFIKGYYVEEVAKYVEAQKHIKTADIAKQLPLPCKPLNSWYLGTGIYYEMMEDKEPFQIMCNFMLALELWSLYPNNPHALAHFEAQHANLLNTFACKSIGLIISLLEWYLADAHW